MRTFLGLSLLFASFSATAQNSPVPYDQRMVTIEHFDETGKDLSVDGIKMTKGVGIQAEWITWDTDGTTYYVKGDYTGVRTKLQISDVGAAAQEPLFYRMFPVLEDRRGDVYTIDDSVQHDYVSKIQHWWTSAGVWQGAKIAVPFGAVAGIVDQVVHADANVVWRGFVYATVAYIGRAAWDLFKSHRDLNRPLNFFTRPVARNVERMEYVRDQYGTLDIKFTYKNGDSKGQPEYISQIYAKPEMPNHQHQDCIEFLKK